MAQITAEIFWGKGLKPTGEFILLKMKTDIRSLVSKGGIIEPDAGNKKRFLATVLSGGNKVNFDELDFSIGDTVIFNDYDAKYLEEYVGKELYLITRPVSVMAVYEIE